MFIKTTNFTPKETDVEKTVTIGSPRFVVEEVRKLKAFIRFHCKDLRVHKQQVGMEIHDLYTIMKYGRCNSYQMIANAVHTMTVRVPGKESDSVYVLGLLYEDGNVIVTIKDCYTVSKDMLDVIV